MKWLANILNSELTPVQKQHAIETKIYSIKEDGKITRWTRPAIVWSGLILMTVTDVIVPVSSFIATGTKLELKLDPNFWSAWSWCVAIYVGGRSIEKIGVSNKLTRAITGKGAPE